MLKIEFNSWTEYIKEADEMIVKITSNSPEIEKLQDFIKKCSGILTFACLHNLTADEKYLIKDHINDSIEKMHKKINLQNSEEIKDILHKLTPCHPKSYYASLLKWSGRHLNIRSIAKAWKTFIEKIETETGCLDLIIDESNTEEMTYNSQVSESIIKNEPDKKKVHNCLKKLHISSFISDIIRFKIYSILLKIHRRMDLNNILKKKIFNSKIMAKISELDLILHKISKEGKILDFDYTETVKYILQIYSLMENFDINKVYSFNYQ